MNLTMGEWINLISLGMNAFIILKYVIGVEGRLSRIEGMLAVCLPKKEEQ